MKYTKFLTFVLFLFLIVSSVYAQSQSQKIDVIDFMRADFDYNGFTQYNSYLAINIHNYDSVTGEWKHSTELPTCPLELESCEYTNWKARNMIREKPGEYHP